MRVWNLMGGLDWSAVPIVFEMFGVDDPELLITQLAAVRDGQREK